MTVAEIVQLVATQIPASAAAETPDNGHPGFSVAAESWHDVARFLRDDPRLAINSLRCVTGLDLHPEPQMEIVYDLMRLSPGPTPDALWQHGGTFAVRVRVPRDDAHVASVADVWPTADWHERETYDLLGIRFDNHPDPRRILCPEDWTGFPLRKDYEFPKEYQGIPAITVDAAAAAADDHDHKD